MLSVLAYNISYFYLYNSHARDREWSFVKSFYFSTATTALGQLIVHPLKTVRNLIVASSSEVSMNLSIGMCSGRQMQMFTHKSDFETAWQMIATSEVSSLYYGEAAHVMSSVIKVNALRLYQWGLLDYSCWMELKYTIPDSHEVL
ncbi:hypothetical protein BDZ45DRAFT_41153 [Acephala macrosclerotiorum]|nr:hypothetical protein BDZ45DRAFT_41153 [Acephala macrosclerotiorum]